ncbi:DUF5711 family protein [Maledivibacter halophilus]|uniref:PQQ-like domain-containing protein n=1 Tax=Maledivibacter halophilus TaxID=36842 RepID=A0A1T5MJ93_9FIRM|nr:DUF5711 family protein [Maledivibacter halophilus]SKC88286.1 hypothetical protein SAMN02194393_04850 [Maledivibacter halophilus]
MTKKRRKSNNLRLIISLLVIASIGFGVVKFVGFITSIFSDEGLTLKKTEAIEYTGRKNEDNKVNIKSFNGYIIKFEEKKLSAYNEDGEQIWEKELDIEDVILSGNKSYIAAVDSLKGKIYYLDYEGKIIIEKSVDKKVMDVKLNDSGYVLIMLENEVFVFDEAGEIVSNFIIPKGEIIDGELSMDNSTIALTILVVEENKFYSNILFYSLDGKVLAGKKFDNEVTYKIFLTRDNNLVVLTNNSMMMMTTEDNILWEKDIGETLNKGILTENELLILNLIKKNNTIIDTKNRSVISQVDLNGNVLSNTPVAGEVLGLDVIDDRIAVFTDRTIYVMDKKGNKIIEKKINKDIKNINWISKKKLLIIYRSKLEIMEIG